MSAVAATNIRRAAPARSQAELAYSMLVDRIVKLDLEPGRMLLDRELTEELGVGRTPIREALQRLAGEGLVVHFPHRGMVVAEITAVGTRDIYEYRSLIDGEAARLAATRATEEEASALLRLSTEMANEAAEGDDVSRYVELDREFYRQLGEASRNQYIAETIPRIFNLHLRLWFYISKMKGDWRDLARAHSAMAREAAEAIVRRDAAAAEVAIRAYVLRRQKDIRMLI